MILPIETVIDEENNTISATVDELGTYCVVDMEKWLSNLLGEYMPETVNLMSDDYDEFYIEVEETPDFSEEETRISKNSDMIEADIMSDEINVEETMPMSYAAAMYAAPYAPGFTPVEKGAPVDVVFLLQTAGNHSSYFNSQLTMIKNVTDKLQKSYGKENVRICIITYSLSGAKILSPDTWFSNTDNLWNALSEIKYQYTNDYVNRGAAFSKLISDVSFKKAASKFVFQVINGSTDVGSNYFSELDACSKLSINYSEIMPEGWHYLSSAYGKRVAEAIAKTGGVTFRYNSTTTTEAVYKHICEYAAPPTTEYMVTIANSWKKINLKGILDPDSDTDTDEDGLADWDEVNNKLITFGADGSPQLPKFGECTKFPNRPYVTNGLDRFHSSLSYPSTGDSFLDFLYNNLYVLPIISDPTNKDSDGDAIFDNEDPIKLKYGISERLSIYDRDSLINDLKNYADNDDSLHNIKQFVGGLALTECVNILYSYDKQITDISNTYMLPKTYIQSVLFRELRCYYVQDSVADVMVATKYKNLEYKEYYDSLSFYDKLFMPYPILIGKDDSSTGYGQIFAKTAINANNWAVNKGVKSGTIYDYNNWKERKIVWENLKYDHNYNIEICALVLMWGITTEEFDISNLHHKYWLYDESEIKAVLKRYNGYGDGATDYGETVYKVYQIFRKYNIS